MAYFRNRKTFLFCVQQFGTSITFSTLRKNTFLQLGFGTSLPICCNDGSSEYNVWPWEIHYVLQCIYNLVNTYLANEVVHHYFTYSIIYLVWNWQKKLYLTSKKIILINLNDQQKIISRCVVKNICKILIANRNYLCLLKRDYHEVHFKMDA